MSDFKVRIQEEDRTHDGLADLSIEPPARRTAASAASAAAAAAAAAATSTRRDRERTDEVSEHSIAVSLDAQRRVGLPEYPRGPDLRRADSIRKPTGHLDSVSAPKLPPTIIISEELVNWRDTYVKLRYCYSVAHNAWPGRRTTRASSAGSAGSRTWCTGEAC